MIGPLAAFTSGFLEELLADGYSLGTAARHLGLLADMSAWLAAEQTNETGVTVVDVDRFIASANAHRQRRLSRRGVVRLVRFLDRHGVVTVAATTERVDATGVLLSGFVEHLVGERGLSASCIRNYSMFSGLFVAGLPQAVQADLITVGAAQVAESVRSCCAGRRPGWVRNFAAATRSLLRFGFRRGFLMADLSRCVMPVASGRRSGLPAAVGWPIVERLIASCAQPRPGALRDRAILLLLARLGLRAGEVAMLTLDDFEWRAGEIVVCGKGARRERLPLPVDVGEAVIDYIRHGRPASDSRALFLLTFAPHTAATTKTVAGVVRCACDRVGIDRFGPHRLRHSAATAMLNRGATLDEIRQVLRHEHRDTTAIYAKVDLNRLRTLAPAWPVVER